MKLPQKLIFAAVIFSLISISKSFASGYATNLYSTSALGNSYAGSVTGIHDASDIFFNPAVAADLDHNQFIASLSYINLSIKNDKASGSSNAGVDSFIPSFYLANKINDQTTFNLAITSPYGLATKYDKGWVGRYAAIESSVSTININPSLSYKVSDKFSVGLGVVTQYYQGILTKAVYTGGNDALGKLNGNGWGYGYNLGLKYKLNDQLKLGIGYRSKINYNLKGTTKIVDLGMHSSFNSKTSTPESLTLGASYDLTKKIELAYDATWTRWSRLKTFFVKANENSNLNDSTTFNWHNSFLHSLGANFRISENSLIRTGLAFEKDAITNANREPRVPGSDKYWVSLGFNQKVSNGWSVDGAYIHQFFRAAKISSLAFDSKIKTKVDVISVALKKDF